jgi:uncharacterized protein (TIGR00255 family)
MCVAEDKIQDSKGVLQSMTGFSQSVCQIADGGLVRVEMRSVNSRFLDIIMKGARLQGHIESSLRQKISAAFSRGKIEVLIYIARPKVEAQSLNHESAELLFREMIDFARKHLPVTDALQQKLILASLKRSEVWNVNREDSSEILSDSQQTALDYSVTQAINELLVSRYNEGSNLRKDISNRIELVRQIYQRLCSETSQNIEKLFTELQERVGRLISQVRSLDAKDSDRLWQEVALIADKADVEEELVRIKSHLVNLDKAVESSPCGKKLEFYLQELQRELTTIGSKVRRSQVTDLVVQGKLEVERLREQVCNIE